MAQTTDSPRTRSSRAPGRSGGVPRSAVPSPPRRRRPALTALAVLLIVGGAALAGLLAVRMDSRTPVLVVSQDVAPGQQITRAMLSSVNVSGDVPAIPTSQASTILDKLYARQTLYKGTVLTESMLRRDPPLTKDQAQVGIPLSPGKYPPGLRGGDAVRLLRIGDAQTPSRALATGYVLDVKTTKSSGFGSSGGSSVALVIVPQSVSDQVVGATGGDDLGIALIARGVSVADADVTDLSTTTR